MSIATVVTITGQAWARDPDGNLRELAVGDVLEEGETLVTSSNGNVQLDFDDGLPPTTIGGDEEVAMTNDVDAENAPDQDETAAQDSEVEALLSALEEEDGDLLELLEATAAGGGAAGGGGGGSDFVQLARIEESVQGLQYEYAGGIEGGPEAVEFAEVPAGDEEGEADDTVAVAGITLDPITGDDTINESEAGQIITLTGSVTGDAGEGDTVTLIIGDQTYTGLVDADGNFAIDVDGDVLAANDTVDASVSGTDDSGNEFSADTSRDYEVDTTAEAGITIDPVTADNTVNETEAGQVIAITGSVSGDAAEGDTVTLTIGENEYTGQVDADGNYAIDVDGDVLAENDTIDANVSGTDDAGNEFSADNVREYAVDTEASATISIDTIAGDDVINGAEAEEGNLINITGSVTGDASEGDIVTLTIGESEYTGQVDADGNYAIDVDGSVLAENDNVRANVSGTDEAGNEFSADNAREYAVFTEAEAGITIDPVTDDNTVNETEADQIIAITGSVTGDAAEGDTVTLTIGDQSYEGTVGEDLTYAIDVDGDVLAANDTIDANVSGTDDAGNEFSADNSRDYNVDTEASATISIDPVTDDNTVNETEAGQTITITGSVTGDAAEGDTVTLTIGDQSYEGTVGEDLTYAIDVDGDVLAANDTIDANVSGTDDAGNEFSADTSRDYNVDTTAEAGITIDPVTDDNTVNETEAGQIIAITGSVTGDAAEGDTVTLTIGDQSYEGTVGEDLTYAIDVDGDVLAANDTIDANVSGTDDAGNEFSADTSRDYNVDTEASATISIDPVTDDNTVNETEAGQIIAITGSVTGDAAEGDTVTLTIGDQNYEGTVGEDLTYSIDVDGEVLAANDTVSAEVTGTDEAGNTFSADAIREYNVAPNAQDDTNEVAFNESLNVGENDGVLSNDTDPDGDTLTVTEVEGSAANVGAAVQGKFGTLTLDSDGSYDYVSNQPQPVLYGFVEGDDNLQNNLLNNFTLDTAALQRVQVTANKGVGVAGSNDGRDVPEQINDNGEVMVADMGDSIEGAGFSFGVSNLFNNENGGESGAWYTYNEAGERVGSGTFGPDDVAYQNGSNNVGRVNVSAEDAGDFRYIAFEGLAYENSDVDTDGGDYFLTDITLQESFDYTITDGEGGSDSATLTVDSTSNLAGYEIPLTLDDSQTALVDEDGLENGIAGGPGDREGQGDDESTFTGKIGVAGAESLDFAGMDGQTATVGQEQVSYGWANGVLTATISDSPAEDRVDESLFTVELDDAGNYTVTLLENVLHDTLDGEEGDNTENDASVVLDYSAQNADGDTQTGKLTIDFNDDTPTVEEADTVTVTTEGIPNIYVGNVDFAGNNGSQSQFTFADGNVVVTGQGFESANDLDLVEAEVNQSDQGLGVASEASPYHNLANEVDFRKTVDGDEASETLTIALQNGQVAYGAQIKFAKMFDGSEEETGIAEFYRDGELISTQPFNSDADSGNFADNFQVEDGGFDTIVLKADDNGKGPNHNDNSDFTVSSIEFTGSTGAPIGYAKSSLDANYGADGPGSLALTGLASEVALKDGTQITDIDAKDNAIVARDGDGELVFQLQLTPATGQWEFFQYQQLASSDVAFHYQVTDADGDSVDGSFALEAMTNSAPESTDDEVATNENEVLTLSQSDFGQFSDADSEDQLADIRIDTLPDADAGVLTLNGETVQAGDEISAAAIDNGELQFTPATNSDADTALEFSVSDGFTWSEESYALTLNVDAVANVPTVSLALSDSSPNNESTISYSGYSAKAFNGNNFYKGSLKNGEASLKWKENEEVIETPQGLGVQKNAHESEPGIDDNETLVLDLSTTTTSATFALNMPAGASAISGSYALFNSEGEQVGKPRELSLNTNGTLTVESDTAFQYVAFEGHSAGKGASDSGYLVDPQSLLLNGNTIDISQAALGESVTQTVVDSYDHIFDLSASLQDQDGSESLSLVIEGLPEGATLDQGEPNDDGSWTLVVDGQSFDGQVTVTAPAAADSFTLTAKALATESNPGTSDETVAKEQAEATDMAEVQLLTTASNEQAITSDGSLVGNLLDNVDFGSDGQGANGGLKSLKVGDTSYTPDVNGDITINKVLGGTLNANLNTGEYTLSGAAVGTTTLQVMAEDADGDEVAFDFDITSAGDNTTTETDDFSSGDEGWDTYGTTFESVYVNEDRMEVWSGETVHKTYSGFDAGDTVKISFDAETSNYWESSDSFKVIANGQTKFESQNDYSGSIDQLEAIADDNGNITLSIENNSSHYGDNGENLHIDNVKLTSGSSVGNILVGDDDKAEQFVLDDSVNDATVDNFDVEADVLDLSDLLDDGDSGTLDDYFATASNDGDDVKIEIGQNGQSSSKTVTLKDVSAEDLGVTSGEDFTHLIQNGKLDIE